MSQFRQMYKGANFEAKEFYQPMTGELEGEPTVAKKPGRLVNGEITIAEKAKRRAEQASKQAEEVTGKAFTKEQQETVKEANETVIEEDDKKADQVIEKVNAAVRENRNYAEEFSEHATVKRLLKERGSTLSDSLRSMLEESYAVKPVVKDAKVRADAQKWLDEGGLENAINYAKHVREVGGTNEEGLRYMELTTDRINDLINAIETETSNYEKAVNDNGYEFGDNGFVKDGKTVDSFKVGDKEYSFEAWEALKQEKYDRSMEAADVADTILDVASEAGRILRTMQKMSFTPEVASNYLDRLIRRSIEFSPLGLAKGVANMAFNVKKGKVSASTAITQLSRGLTGTGMFALGVLLANMGALSKPEDDEEKTAYYKSNIYGKQDLALHIGDTYYSIDWAMPSASPLMMGATMADMFHEHGRNLLDYDLKEVLSQSAEALNPVLEASYLGSLNDFVTSMAQGINYGGEVFGPGFGGWAERTAESVAENFVGQLTPTVGGAINRTIDSTKRTTSGNTMAERIKNRTIMNIPGMSGMLEPAIDQKGNQIENFGGNALGRAIYNFASPSTITVDTHDELDDKLMEAGEGAMPRTQTGSGGLKGQIVADLSKAGMTIGDITSKEYTKVKQTYYGNYNDYVKDYTELQGYNKLSDKVRDGIYTKLEQLALAEAKATYYGKIGDTDKLFTDEQKAALALKEQGISPAQFYMMKNNGLTGNRKALYVMSELETLGVADTVVNDLMDGKYKSSAVGLTDSVVLKTPDEREDARMDYLAQDEESLESMAANYRGTYAGKEETDEEGTTSLREAAEKKYISSAADQLLETRAMNTGMTKNQYRSYQDIEADKRPTGGSIAYTQQLKVAKAMMQDGTWEGYREAYEAGELNQDDLSKIHLNKTFLKWSDAAIEKAIETMNKGEWVDLDTFKKSYGSVYGSSRKSSGSSRGSSSRSSGSSTASASVEPSEMLKLYAKALKSGSSGSDIKASVGSSSGGDAALWDKIVNGSKKDVESLRKELKL